MKQGPDRIWPVTDSEIDDAILAVAQPSWRKVAMIMGKTAEKLRGGLPDGDEGYILIAKRISKPVSEGRLAAQGNVGRWRNGEVRLPQ
jgi:hypothetical protein